MFGINFHSDENIRINNKRVGGIILKEKSLLLMYRKKNDREFYTFPGGHMREGEDEVTTLEREIQEEATLSIRNIKPAFTLIDYENDKVEYFYTAAWQSGEATLGGEELEKSSPENFYQLVWLELSDVSKLNILPKAAKEWVQDTLCKK